MSLTPNEAANTLRDIEATGRASSQAFGYRHSGKHLIIWGLVWVAGYSAMDFFPRYAGPIWLTLSILGALAASFVGSRDKANNRRNNLQILGLVAVAIAFVIATDTIMWPVNVAQQAAFIPLLAAAAYTAVGLWEGPRWIVAGVVLAALTLGGFFYIHEHFSLYMGAVGGGSLILAGLWMRSA